MQILPKAKPSNNLYFGPPRQSFFEGLTCYVYILANLKIMSDLPHKKPH